VEIDSQTPDLPRAGQPYSAEAFAMVLDMVNIFNAVTPTMWQERPQRKGKRQKVSIARLEADPDGLRTVDFLNSVKKAAGDVPPNVEI
jgi:hypothetical protein